MQFLQVLVQLTPGVASRGLDDPDQQEGESAKDDVGTDPVFEPVVDRPRLRGGLCPPVCEVPELGTRC
jgi:hypothetical protein